MFRDFTTLATELSPAEQTAFEALVRAVGFTREVRFGHGSEARVLRDFPTQLVYALTPVDRVAGQRLVREYRLYVAVVGDTVPKQNGPRPKLGRPRKTRGNAEPAPTKQGSPEYKAKMQAVGRANWRKRLKKYGPTGFTPGREPWKQPSNIAYQKHQAKLAREQAEPKAPSHAIKTF